MMALWMVFLEFGLKLMVAERLGLQGAIPPVEAGRQVMHGTRPHPNLFLHTRRMWRVRKTNDTTICRPVRF